MTKRILSFLLAVVLVAGLVMLSPMEAKAASQMEASIDVINYLKEMEGFTAIPYWDYSQWTVGFGNRCPDEYLELYKKEGIPIADAHALFASQLATFVAQVNAFIDRKGITLTQNQFDSVLCLTYNKGGAWLSMENEPLVEAIVEGNLGNKLVAAMSLTVYAGGEFLPGLMRRRLIEADMYLYGRYGRTQRENFCYVRYDGNGGTVSRSVQGYDIDLPIKFYCEAYRPGYTFLGWFTEPEGGTEVTTLDKSTDKLTLYAHWKEGVEETPIEPQTVTVTTYQLNVRADAGTKSEVVGAVYRDQQVQITAIIEVEGIPWGKIDQGWICLSYTDYTPAAEPEEPEEPEQIPVPLPPEEEDKKIDTLPQTLPLTATVTGTASITVYNGPHSSYPQVGTVAEGTVITITEIYDLLDVTWGKTDLGWVRTDRYLLFDGYEPLAHSFVVTNKINYLYIRSGPSTDYSRLGYAHKGDQFTITALFVCDGITWGRFETGWIGLEYSDYDSEKLPYYQQHTYGDWSQTQEPTCSQPGQESRQCQDCGYLDTRPIETIAHSFGNWYPISDLVDTDVEMEQRDCENCSYFEQRELVDTEHIYGSWYVVTEATCTQEGSERRDCQHCDEYQIRPISCIAHDLGQWQTEVAPLCTVDGRQRRVCENCDYYEIGAIAALGHDFGQWQTHRTATCQAEGLQRRECACGMYETRALEKTDHSFGQWYTVSGATETQQGLQRRDCEICGEYETQQIPMTEAPVQKTYGTLTGYSYLNIRQGLGTGYAIVGKLTYGQRVQILEQAALGSNVWGRTEQGWVCLTGYMTLETVQAGQEPAEPESAVYATITVSALRIRKGPGTGYTCLGWLYHGQRVQILEQRFVGSTIWGRISDGWICLTDYTSLKTEAPSADASTPAVKTYGTLTGYSFLNIRAGAGTAYALVGKLFYGDRVQILETKTSGGSTWGRIEKGWICLTGYVTLTQVTEYDSVPNIPQTPSVPDAGEQMFVIVTTASLSVRQGPGTSYDRLGYVYMGARLEIFEQKQVGSDTWGRTEQGWICLTGYTRVEVEEDQEQDQQPVMMTVAVETLNVRSGAGLSFGVVTTLGKGTKVTVLEEMYAEGRTWVRIAQGWVAKEYLETSN